MIVPQINQLIIPCQFFTVSHHIDDDRTVRLTVRREGIEGRSIYHAKLYLSQGQDLSSCRPSNLTGVLGLSACLDSKMNLTGSRCRQPMSPPPAVRPVEYS